MDKSSAIPLVGAILAFIAAALGAWNTHQTNSVEASLKQLESERQVMFKLYDSIVATYGAAEADRLQRIRALRVLVQSLAKDEVRDGFLAALEVQEVEIFEGEEAAKPPPVVAATGGGSGAGSGVAAALKRDGASYDIFWCSRSGVAAESLAQKLEALLKSNGSQRARTRVLPESIRQRKGYRIEGNVIRAEQDETELATHVKLLAEKEIGLSFDVAPFNPGKPTPNYLSVFVCPMPGV